MKTMIKKLLMLGMMVFIFSVVATETLSACEIEFEVIENEKDVYQAGDEIIVKVEVVFTHRVCTEGIEATKFNYEGMKILGATKWEEIKSGTFERKLKIQIEKTDPDGLVLNAIRTCDKEGGMGSIRFIVE